MNENASENLQIRGRLSTADYALIALFAAVMAVCSWISIPATVPFTMQTFGVFLTVGLLGGKRGTLAILVYLLLGSVGAPVFSGFTGGIGHVLGPTGGYMVGFLAIGILYILFEKLSAGERFRGKTGSCSRRTARRTLWEAITLILGLFICYAIGTAWFLFIYTGQNGAVSLGTVLGWCVFPFIIPDLVKLALALAVGRRIRRSGLFL